MNIKSENLLNEIEKRKEDLIDLTQKLIRIPTLNPPGNNYLEICEFLKQRMETVSYTHLTLPTNREV